MGEEVESLSTPGILLRAVGHNVICMCYLLELVNSGEVRICIQIDLPAWGYNWSPLHSVLMRKLM